MRLTNFTDYTLRVLIYLGVNGDGERLVTISDIAGAYGISENHLMKVVHHLAKQGHVETTRGKGGGMRLARPPSQINIGDVVRGAEDELAVVACFQAEGEHCPIVPVCALRGILDRAMNAFMGELDRHTLADLIQPQGTLAGIFGIAVPRQ